MQNFRPRASHPYVQLTHILATEPPDSTNRVLALCILHTINEIGSANLSTNMLASRCNVSKPTIVRFCRSLGFESFTDFKFALVQSYDIGSTDAALSKMPSITNYDRFAAEYLDEVQQSIQWMKDTLPVWQLKELAQEIVRRKNIYLFGNSQAYDSACNLMNKLLVQGIKAEVVSATLKQAECIRNMEENALGIVLSVNGHFWDTFVDRTCFSEKKPAQRIYWLTCNPPEDEIPGIDRVIRCGPRNDLAGGNLCIDLVINLILQFCWQMQKP